MVILSYKIQKTSVPQLQKFNSFVHKERALYSSQLMCYEKNSLRMCYKNVPINHTISVCKALLLHTER